MKHTNAKAPPNRRRKPRTGRRRLWQEFKILKHNLDAPLLRLYGSAVYVQVYVDSLTAGRGDPGGENVFGRDRGWAGLLPGSYEFSSPGVPSERVRNHSLRGIKPA